MATVLELIIPGAMALGGVWLQKHLQTGDKKADRQAAKNELLRSKAETIYLAIESAMRHASDAALDAVRESFNVPLKLTEEDWVAIRLSKIKALMNLYFPGAEKIFEEFESAIILPLEKHSAKCKEIKDSAIPVDEKLKESHNSKIDCAMECQKVTNAALIKLRRFLDTEVRKLM